MSHPPSLRAANHIRRGALDPVQRETLATVLLAIGRAIVDDQPLPTYVHAAHGAAVRELTERPTGGVR